MLLDEVREDFRVRFPFKGVSLGSTLLAQRKIVFDYSVVDDDDLALTVAMGWRFSLVGRPCVDQRVWPIP